MIVPMLKRRNLRPNEEMICTPEPKLEWWPQGETAVTLTTVLAEPPPGFQTGVL